MGLAPAAPEAGLSVGLILLAIACVFLLALNKMWKLTLGALLSAMADMVSSLPHVTILGHHVPPWNALANGITELDNYVLEAIGVGIQQTEKGLHALVGAMTWLFQETADQLAGLAEDTAKAFDYTKRILVPTLLGVALAPLLKEIAHLAARTRTIVLHPTTIVKKAGDVIAPGLKALEGKVSALEARVAAIGAAAPVVISSAGIGLSLPKAAALPGEIARGLDSLWKRVRGMNRTLTAAGIVGLVVAALGRLGLGWARCSNTSKLGKSVCGMNTNLLEGLLADALLFASVVSIVEFAKELQGIEAEVVKGVRYGVKELKPGYKPVAGKLH
jgi:hypothetical protein